MHSSLNLTGRGEPTLPVLQAAAVTTTSAGEDRRWQAGEILWGQEISLVRRAPSAAALAGHA